MLAIFCAAGVSRLTSGLADLAQDVAGIGAERFTLTHAASIVLALT